MDCTIEIDPMVILPSILRDTRALETVAVPGVRKVSGTVVAPLFPDAGMILLAGALGAESATVGSTPTNSTTLAAAATAGATTISTTATPTTNDILQIGTDATDGAECRKVVSVTGSGPYTVTLDVALSRAHSNGAAVAKVVAPFTHTVLPANTLPSFSLEKNMDGADIQYSGLVNSKMDLKCALNAVPQATYTLEGQQAQIDNAPSTPTWPTDVPFGPTNITWSFGGTDDLEVTDGTLSIDNGTKPYPTFNGETYPVIVTATSRKVSVQCTHLLQALAGGAGSQGYWADLAGAPSRALSLAIAAGSNTCTFTMPAAVLTKYSDPIKVGDLVTVQTQWDVMQVEGQSYDLEIVIANANYLSY